jgi:putative transposase
MAERPNELWVADITFLPTLTGFLYLAVVLDAWSRRIVGGAFSADLKTRVVLDALDMALAANRQAPSATPTTMRCARVSSPPSNAS